MSGFDQHPPSGGPVDVQNAYSLFLGRSPEAVYGNEWSSATDLAKHFINSEEFELEVAGPIINGCFPRVGRHAGLPTPSMLLWISSVLPVSDQSRNTLLQAKDWREVLLLLFSDATFTKAVDVEDKDWNLALLAARLVDQDGGGLRKSIAASRQTGIRRLLNAWRAERNDRSPLGTIAAAPDFAIRELPVEHAPMDRQEPDPSKSTILLVCEASRTGSPILAWNLVAELSANYNVVVVLTDSGELEFAFRTAAAAVVGPVRDVSDPFELRTFVSRLVSDYKPLYVIGSGIESSSIAIVLRESGCPLVLLVHDFSNHSISRGTLARLYGSADHIVFPSDIVAKSFIMDNKQLGLQNLHIIVQGPTLLPPSESDRLANQRTNEAPVEPLSEAQAPDCAAPSANRDTLLTPSPAPKFMSKEGAAGQSFIVLGLGDIDLRHGVDLFIATATCLRRIAPDLQSRFVWIGQEVDPSGAYNILLNEQIIRSGLGSAFEILENLNDLSPVYESSDVLFVSSRLDPLPSVAIDAATHGLPIVCFQNAVGIAEFLALDEVTAHLAVPHLDVGAAAEVLARLADDKPHSDRLGAHLKTRASKMFDMPRYAARLDALGLAAAKQAGSADESAELLARLGNFDAPLFAGQDAGGISQEVAIKRYLDESRKWAFFNDPVLGLHPRRPLAGFHPMAYATEYDGFPRDGSANPLVHFLKEGRPEGNWTHRTIRIDNQQKSNNGLSAVIHGHFHYTDNFLDFLEALNANRSPIDLILTTTSLESEKYLRKMVQQYERGTVTLRVGRNVGRDVGPFLELLSEGTFDRYDVVGHIHGKRSLHRHDDSSAFGDRWRVFLWEHLLGPSHPVADIILRAMDQDPTLGLVFPENAELIGWEQNFTVGKQLAIRMGLKKALPLNVDFPVGTMFWARPEALLALVRAGITASDFPEEPLPLDGTMLHAIERLLTPAALDAGYSIASTYNPRITRT